MALFEELGTINCLVKSLNASNKGWNKPNRRVLLGPKRKWKEPIILRSNSV